MASLPTRTTASFQAIQPIPSAAPLDAEFNQYVGAAGIFNGGTTATKLLVKTSDPVDPPIAVDQVGAGLLLQAKQNGVEKFRVENDGDIVGNGITGAAGIYTFGSIPLGPASDPTTANQLARKAYIDAKRYAWAATFTIPDVAARGSDANFDNVQGALIPTGAFTATHIDAKFLSGSASGSFTLECRKIPFSGTAQTLLGSITFNPGTLGVPIETDIADHLFTAGDWVYFVISTLSSPLQKAVWCSVRGTKTPE